MRYNWAMTQWRRPRLWFALALAVVLIVVAVLWLRGTLPGGGSHSPLPAFSLPGTSPLPTPTPSSTAPPSAWTGGGAALTWVALGIVLALGAAFLILRRHRHDV